MELPQIKHCLHCGLEFRGRADKVFCDQACRSAYNNARIRSRHFKPKVEKDHGVLEMTLTPEMDKLILDKWPLEIEMLQGEKKKLPDGRTWYRINIYEDWKNEMIMQFILRCLAHGLPAQSPN